MKRHVETIGTIMEWHEQTFPDATFKGQCLKFEEEWTEALRAKTNEERLKELADTFIVACGVFRFDTTAGLDKFAEVYGLAKEIPWFPKRDERKLKSFTPQEVWDAVVEKMKVNRAREWKKSDDGRYRHKEEKSEEQAEEIATAGEEIFRPFFNEAEMRSLHTALMENAWRTPPRPAFIGFQLRRNDDE